jgi:hypothetical protein
MRGAVQFTDMTEPLVHLIWETFVVRVWREPTSGAWRGEIVHVPDRAAIHFASFAQAEEFVRRYVPTAEFEGSDTKLQGALKAPSGDNPPFPAAG